MSDGSDESTTLLGQLVSEWRRRAALIQTDVRTVEALLRCRRALLLQTQVCC